MSSDNQLGGGTRDSVYSTFNELPISPITLTPDNQPVLNHRNHIEHYWGTCDGAEKIGDDHGIGSPIDRTAQSVNSNQQFVLQLMRLVPLKNHW